jgi:hypothetical protein
MEEKSPANKKLKADQLVVAGFIKEGFRAYCKDQKVNMKDSLEEILGFIIKNKIGLMDLQQLMDKNLTKEVMRYHNYTVGFLKEFEKRQLEMWKKLIGILEGEGAGESRVLKIFMQEILLNQQYLIAQSGDKNEVEMMIKRNDENIQNALNDNKN